MRENTPPASPFHDEDDDLVYVGDNIDEVIEELEHFTDDGAIAEDGKHNLFDSNCVFIVKS